MEGNGDNESGFSALSGGARSISGDFGSAGRYGYWLTVNEYNVYSAWGRSLHCNSDKISRRSLQKSAGNSVRCVKD